MREDSAREKGAKLALHESRHGPFASLSLGQEALELGLHHAVEHALVEASADVGALTRAAPAPCRRRFTNGRLPGRTKRSSYAHFGLLGFAPHLPEFPWPPSPASPPSRAGSRWTPRSPRLLGTRCATCGTVYFPKETTFCRNPGCAGTEFAETELSPRGRLWSFTNNCYAAARALRLAGPVRALRGRRRRARGREDGRARPGRDGRGRRAARGRHADGARARHALRGRGSRVRRLEVEAAGRSERHEPSKDVAILGVGMHPWGKWGRNFVEYGVAAARAALADAGLEWKRRPVRRRRRHHPQRLSRLRRRRDLRAGARLDRRAGRQHLRRVRLGRAGASTSRARRSSPACATSRSWSAPTPRRRASSRRSKGERGDDPDWLRFRLLGATNPIYFGLYARRRMEALRRHARGLRAGEGEEQPPRPRQPERALPQGGARVDEVLDVAGRLRSAAPARHLRDQRRRRGARARRAWSSRASTRREAR